MGTWYPPSEEDQRILASRASGGHPSGDLRADHDIAVQKLSLLQQAIEAEKPVKPEVERPKVEKPKVEPPKVVVAVPVQSSPAAVAAIKKVK